MNTILTIGLVLGLTIITTASLSTILFQEVYAPSARRGFYCEFRPTAMTDSWMPYTQPIIEQVAAEAATKEALS